MTVTRSGDRTTVPRWRDWWWAPYALLTCPLVRALDWLGRDIPIALGRAEHALLVDYQEAAAA